MKHIENNANDKINSNITRIGILGGTFDPIHNGHLNIARAAKEEYNLSKVILIPTGVSYMKTDVTDAYFRFEMVKLAACEYPNFEVSDVEIQREGNTYTCDTIAYFKDKFPDAELFFIIGTDSLFSLGKWRNVGYILANCTILCATRPGEGNADDIKQSEKDKAKELSEQYNGKIDFIHSVPMDISSTDIRNYRKNHPDSDLSALQLPDSVAKYIVCHDLYDDKTEEIHKQLKNALKPKRWCHTMGVVETAVALAQKWGCNVEYARLAALLHDCAKYLELEQKCFLCAKYEVSVSETELANPELLHAKAGALLAFEQYGIHNKDVLSAIFYHTTGKPNMSLLEQIVFVADYIEPGRTHSDKLPKYREMALEDLNLVTAHILKDTVKYLKKQEEHCVVIDPLTQESYEFYKKFL